MRTTSSQDRDFIATIVNSSVLEEAIEFIKKEFDAEDIFGKDALHDWAVDNGYVKEE